MKHLKKERLSLKNEEKNKRMSGTLPKKKLRFAAENESDGESIEKDQDQSDLED
jgi:hypothetical protein